MKFKNIGLLLLSSFLLSGCELLDNFFDDVPQQEEHKETPSSEESEEKEYEIPTDKVGEFYGGLVNDNVHVGYEFVASLEAIEKPKTGRGEVKIYSFNDFHGAVLQTKQEPGIKAFASYYKEKSQEDNTLIFDQGDTWQGSLESNYCDGAIVQDVFNYAGVSLRTVGNHDFDWGLEQLEETINRKMDGDYIPCLAANVYDFKDGKTGTTQQSQYGKEYATFTLENGIKVGVVGVIGTLMSSICSNRIETVNFINPIKVIKEMSDYLRMRKKCDIVVASTHNAISYDFEGSLADISPVSNKHYVDLVLGGHEHTRNTFDINGVYFVQSDSHGKSSELTTFSYDFENNSLVGLSERKTLTYNDYLDYSDHPDSTISKMVDDYLVEVEEIGNEVLSTHFNGYYSTAVLSNLMSEAIFEKVKSSGFDVDYSYCNSARESYYGNTFTYRDLYRCFPFDNEIVLMEIDAGVFTGYRPSKYGEVDPNKKTHKVAVVDYVALHQDSSRVYDIFPDSVVHSRTMFKDEDKLITYRDILKDFLLANPDRDFSPSNIK